ncbi:MAG: PAS-domain containing protein [Sphaerotilus natans subsp. sulfidivorans]|uniref:sensor domain-containing diguanylate cyclase n=1 Tax=Sphaerotilus sulfidivorans TaxID=639200 RepID=UPI002356A410|nr:PAS-domain containing protein [Sphaerotilus sulfidivorans]MCK6402872.1 PAS-domain containing protein [Sphaerotilus sulfidivorans]
MLPSLDQAILQTIIDHLPSAVTMFDAQLRMVACNRQLRTLLEFPDSLFEPHLPTLYDLALFNAQRGEYGPGDPPEQARALCQRALTMQPHVFERRRPNGTVLEVRGAPLPGGGFVTIYTDITERTKAEQNARRYSAYLDTVINALPQGVTVIDEDLVIQLWNQSFERLLDLPPGLMRHGVTFEDVTRSNAQRGEYGEVDVEARVQQAAALARRFLPHRLTRTRPDGTTLEIEGRALHVDGEVRGFVTTYTDVTEISRSRQAMEHLALHDALTGLANRHQFSRRYSAERDRQRREGGALSLVMADVDHFKQVNDCHGHLVGDACLQSVAQALRQRVRRSDLVARFGGEEFVVLLVDTSAAEALRVAEALRLSVASLPHDDRPAVTASFGVATVQASDELTLDQVLSLADAAVYHAKRDGRNCVRAASAPSPGTSES